MAQLKFNRSGTKPTIERGADGTRVTLRPVSLATAAALNAEAQAAAGAALVAQLAAEAAAALAVDISEIAVPDDVVKTLIENPATDTYAALVGFNNLTGINVLLNGVAGDGVTVDTTAIHAVRNAAAVFGAPLYFPEATYIVDATGLQHSVTDQVWNTHPKAEFKFADGAADITPSTQVINITAAGAHFVGGGTVNGNRGEQDKAAFNAAGGGGAGRAQYGVVVAGSVGTPLPGVVLDFEAINCISSGLNANYAPDLRGRVKVTSSGRGFVIQHSAGWDLDLTARSIDNDDWKIYAHVLDIFSCSKFRYSLDSDDHNGTGTTGAGTSMEDYLVGVTMIDVEDFEIDGMYVANRQVDGLTKGLGVSLLNVRRMRAHNVHVAGYSDVLLENGTVTESTIDGLILDGRYQVSSGAIGRGAAVYNNGLTATRTSRMMKFTDGLKVTNFVIMRCLGDGIDNWMARNTKWTAGAVIGCKRGIQCAYHPTDVTDFVTQTIRDIRDHRFIGVDFSYNELSGAELTDLSNSEFIGCTAHNNGQAIAMGTCRDGSAVDANAAGFLTKTTSTVGLSKTDLEWIGCAADDTQSFTGAVSPNPNEPAVLSVSNDGKYVVGQTVKLVGAGVAAADLVTRINDVTGDEITVETAPTTLATVSGTGTIATTGTAITGTGTNFDGEIDARYWISAGGNIRRIIKVASDTAATLDEAFPVDLAAGTSFTIYKTVTNGIPSQQWGYKFSGDTVSPKITGGKNPTGNVQGALSDANSGLTNRARFLGVTGQVSRTANSFATGGNLTAAEGSGFELVFGSGVGPGSTVGTVWATDTNLYRRVGGQLKTDGKFLAAAGIGVGNSASATTPGSVVKKMEVFDASGTSLGYVPIYSTIT